MQIVLSYHKHVYLVLTPQVLVTGIALSVQVAFIVTQQVRRPVQHVNLALMPYILATVIAFSA